jgi:hypothetical protein
LKQQESGGSGASSKTTTGELGKRGPKERDQVEREGEGGSKEKEPSSSAGEKNGKRLKRDPKQMLRRENRTQNQVLDSASLNVRLGSWPVTCSSETKEERHPFPNLHPSLAAKESEFAGKLSASATTRSKNC